MHPRPHQPVAVPPEEATGILILAPGGPGVAPYPAAACGDGEKPAAQAGSRAHAGGEPPGADAGEPPSAARSLVDVARALRSGELSPEAAADALERMG